MSAVRKRDGAGGRPREDRPPSALLLVIVLITVLLLMGFSIALAVMNFNELSIAAGMASIGLAGDVVRRLLSFTRADGEDTDNASVSTPPASTSEDTDDAGPA